MHEELRGCLCPRPGAPDYLKQNWGLTVALATLEKLASTGGGPAFRRIGRRIVYEFVDLDEWALARLSERIEQTDADPSKMQRAREVLAAKRMQKEQRNG